MRVNDDATGWGDAIKTKRWSPYSNEAYPTVDHLTRTMVDGMSSESAVKYFQE